MDTLTNLINSKKFIASVTASLVALIATYFELDNAAVAAVVAPFIAYILGQGIADNGKEAKMVEYLMVEDSIDRLNEAKNKRSNNG